jgi:hypothetical protein
VPNAKPEARNPDWYLSNVTIEEPRTYEASVVTIVDVPWRERQLEREREESRNKAFVAWDGEGINLDGADNAQAYCLFGASTGDYISSRHGLSSKQCFQTMLRVKYKNPKVIHVGFAISYDAEMMFRDIPHDIIFAVVNGNPRWWGRYRIHYVNKKWFRVSGPYRGKRVSITIYDVFSFFGMSLLKAIKKYIPDTNKDTVRRIEQGKLARGAFTLDQLDSVMVPYWQEELQCTVRLCSQLRTLMHKAELFPRSWHGPAALANYLNHKNGIAKHMSHDAHKDVKDATQYAYAAGRVENFMVGRLCGRAYKYDRNSAYPSAMVHLPSLSDNPWKPRWFGDDWRNNVWHDNRALGLQEFGMYYVDYEYVPSGYVDEDMRYPQPFFHRTRQGNIQFPWATHRWMWGAELIGALDLNCWGEDSNRPMIRIYRGMELTNYDVARPYAFVQEMYDTRLQMKADRLPEEVAVKLGLNSLYGKMAQQKGYREKDAPERPWFEQMPWHQFDWAGFVTSHNRARIYDMALLAAQRGILISIETDAIFTSEPMPELEPGSTELGEWGVETFDDIICLQSGVYLTLNDGKWSFKYRGFDEDSVTVDDVLKYLEATSLYHNDPDEYARNPLKGMTTRFIGAKLANTRAFGMEDDWRVWKTEPKDVTVGDSGKRRHIPQHCRACQDGEYYAATRMHDMSIKSYTDQETRSYATVLPWRKLEHQADVWLPEEEEDDFDLDGITE